MEKPAETTKPKEKHSINWGFIVWPVVILILYILSYGPVAMMVEQGRISNSNDFLRRICVPLNWAYLRTPLHKPLGMYLHMWSPKYFDKNGDQTGLPYGATSLDAQAASVYG